MPQYPHLILDGKDLTVSDDFLNERSYIKAFMNNLVEMINMKRLGRIHIEFLDSPRELVGYSAVLLGHGSNIVLHVYPYDKTVNLDIFSCEAVDSQVVIDLVRRYFEPATISTQIVTRGFSEF